MQPDGALAAGDAPPPTSGRPTRPPSRPAAGSAPERFDLFTLDGILNCVGADVTAAGRLALRPCRPGRFAAATCWRLALTVAGVVGDARGSWRVTTTLRGGQLDGRNPFASRTSQRRHRMPESDLIWLPLLVFLPAVVRGRAARRPRPAGRRPCAGGPLFGTAATLSRQPVRRRRLLPTARLALRRAAIRSSTVRPRRLDDRADQAASDAGACRSRARLVDDWSPAGRGSRRFNIDYSLGVDGISLPLVAADHAASRFLAIIASWKIEKYVRGYLILLLLLETGVIGTFLALDFFLFYVFCEVMLLPMYFLIGVWGGGRRRVRGHQVRPLHPARQRRSS